MDIAQAAKRVSDWAMAKSEIRRVCFFGSRVKGTHTVESDLDIAITLMPNLDESGGLSTWMTVFDEWQKELAAILPYEVQVEWDDGSKTKVIEKGLSEALKLVYEREI